LEVPAFAGSFRRRDPAQGARAKAVQRISRLLSDRRGMSVNIKAITMRRDAILRIFKWH
jgi:hypothetical protein